MLSFPLAHLSPPGHLVGTVSYVLTVPVVSLGNALPAGGEQWGAVAELELPAVEVADPSLVAVAKTSREFWRAGPPRVSLQQLGSSDATVTDRIIASGAQFASFYGNCIINEGVCCFSVELLSAGAIQVGFASTDALRSPSNRSAFANDKSGIMCELNTGVSWVLGDRMPGGKKFSAGDEVTIVWSLKGAGKTPAISLWHKNSSRSSWDWPDFNHTHAGL